MATLFNPPGGSPPVITCPGTGPWSISLDDCMGDSLQYINANTNYLTCQISAAKIQEQIDYNYLLSLIHGLSSNVNNIGNYPYTRLVEVASSVEAPRLLKTVTSSTGAVNGSAVNLFAGSTPTRTLKISSTPVNQLNNIGITINSDNTFQFPSVGIYRVELDGPGIAVPYADLNVALDAYLVDDSNNVILQGPVTVAIDAWGSNSPQISIKGQFQVTSLTTKYKFVVRRDASTAFVVAAPVAVPSAILFDINIWKVG
jgi:hypothetical protein